MEKIFWKRYRNIVLLSCIMYCVVLAFTLTACGTQAKQEISDDEPDTSSSVIKTLSTEIKSQKMSSSEVPTKETLAMQNSEETQNKLEYSDFGVVADEDVIQAFNTFQEFEENEKKQNDGMSAYYVPAVLGAQCSLIGISKREGVYLATSYQVFTQTIHPNANTAYEKELVGSILCTQYLFPVTNETISFFQRNFQEIYYNDSLYYYTESRSLDKSDLLGYEISFIIDQTAFHIHLPAVNSFEEMMQYTKLVKRVIE